MKTLNHEAAQSYIDAGCRVDGHTVVGSVEVVTGVLRAHLKGKRRKSLKDIKAQTGADSEWVNFKPLDILKDAGWGTDREGNLVGGDYEIRRAKTIVETLFG